MSSAASCIRCGLLLQKGQTICSWCAFNPPRRDCTCPVGSYDAPNSAHEPYCALAGDGE